MSALEVLNIQILDKDNRLEIEVLFKPEYVKYYGKTDFYNYFKNLNLFKISVNISKEGISILLFEFLPKRIFLDDEYVYDLMNPDEKKLFRGLGHSILCTMIKYGLEKKYYNLDTVVHVQPSNLYFADSLRDEIPDISGKQATQDFKKLYLYYINIGFEPTEKIDWAKPSYNILPKVSTRMITNVRKLLSKCIFK
jgi:hypothetical protein